MQFIISCCFQILADYDNVFIFIIRLIVHELYNIMCDAVEKRKFENLTILVTLNDSISHVRITCGQPDVTNHSAADYWRETCSYDCYDLPRTVIVLFERDHTVMPELMELIFCSGLDEEEQGKQLYIKLNFLNTNEMCYG